MTEIIDKGYSGHPTVELISITFFELLSSIYLYLSIKFQITLYHFSQLGNGIHRFDRYSFAREQSTQQGFHQAFSDFADAWWIADSARWGVRFGSG